LATPLAGYGDCARSQAGRARENRADHLVERLPAVANLLGLPPGYRFLLADAYEEVWFDENLLNV
jgi:hypothetical protein